MNEPTNLFDLSAIRTYFNSSPDCVFHFKIDEHGQFIYDAANPATINSAGISINDLIGRTPCEALGETKSAVVSKALERVRKNDKPFKFQPTWETPHGPVTFDAVYIPQHNSDGVLDGILCVARDITKYRLLEMTSQQKQKMEALGHMACGISHDFTNVLSGIKSCLALLSKGGTEASMHAVLDEGLKYVDRGVAITRRMTAFAHKEPYDLLCLNLNAVIDGLDAMAERTLGDILFSKQLADDLWLVNANKQEVETAIMNLISNACDAMPDKGTLTITTENVIVSSSRNADLLPGTYARITVSDTGSGMTPDVLQRAFEPFFTTKASDKGTGLGLSLLHGMMSQLGGMAAIDSAPSNGTRVYLYFPSCNSGGSL